MCAWCACRGSRTRRPSSQSATIAAMERHGIGTDATVADHIQKQLDRYAAKDVAPPSSRPPPWARRSSPATTRWACPTSGSPT